MSPPVVFLTPPEKLVLEVRASGGYDFIAWSRVDDRSFRQNAMTELVNFHEIFVRQPTTTSEHGTYMAQYSMEPGEARILVVPTGMLYIFNMQETYFIIYNDSIVHTSLFLQKLYRFAILLVKNFS